MAGIIASTYPPPVQSSSSMDTIHEETIASRPASGITINIGFFPTIPATFSYGPPSYAISSSEYTQSEHENVRLADLEHDRRLMELEFSHGLHYYTDSFLEDRIIIECIDNTNIACQPHMTEKPAMARLFMARSHLMHSRWFVKWFSSPYYLARAGMKVTWHRDPIACWEMAKYYMEDGYDQFGTIEISAHVCSRFRLADRFIVLIRLYKLARVLELFGLMDGALTVLKQTEHLVSPANMVTLARYIFGGEDYCENISHLRKWCLKLISKHFDWLIKSDQWAQVVKDAVPDLEEQWMKMTTNKRAVPQEQLKKTSKQNLRDAKAFIDAVTIVHHKPDGSTERKSENATDAQLIPSTPERETLLTQTPRDEVDTPTKKPKPRKGPAEMTILQQIHSLRENLANDSVESLQAAFPSRKSSLRKTSEGQGDSLIKSGDRLKVPGPGSPLGRKSSFREVFELDMSNGMTINQNGEWQPDSLVDRMTESSRRPGAGILSTSISEPLLTSRRFGDISKHVQDGPFSYQEDANDIARPASENAVTTFKTGDGAYSQRGVIVTVGDVNEPDSWPLADIPLPDPLLPFARAPSLDSGSPIRENFRASAHHAQAVTIFGIHRPGMGGSIISIDENTALNDSEKRSPNQAKAREYLGIDTPAPGGMSRPKSRAAGVVEGRKLRKKNQWLARLGE